MTDVQTVLEDKRRQAIPPENSFERLLAARRRRSVRRRVVAGLVASLLAIGGVGLVWITLGSLRGERPVGPSEEVGTAVRLPGGVPNPPVPFGFHAEKLGYNRGWTVQMTAQLDYAVDANSRAEATLTFYRRVMLGAGWRLAAAVPLRSLGAYPEFPMTTYGAWQVWARGTVTARIYITTFASTKPGVALLVTTVPVHVKDVTEPLHVGGANGLLEPIPSGGPKPRLGSEAALNRAWIDFVGASASRIDLSQGRLIQRTFADRVTWLVAFHDACLPAADAPSGCPWGTWNEVIDAETGEYIFGYNS